MFYLKQLVENSAFGVCSTMGEWMGISTKRIRLFFVYSTFITLGSPIIVYMIMAFWLNLKNYSKEKRTKVWDL